MSGRHYPPQTDLLYMASVFGHTFTLHHLRGLLLGWDYDGIVETG